MPQSPSIGKKCTKPSNARPPVAIDLKRYQQLKAAADAAQSEADKAAGAAEQILAKLKADYGCANLAAAERKAKELDAAATAAEEEYNAALAEFENEWGGRLDGLPGNGSPASGPAAVGRR